MKRCRKHIDEQRFVWYSDVIYKGVKVMARYSEAHNRANQKWQREHRYRINAFLPIDWKSAIIEKSAEFGSVNAYLKNLIMRDLGLDDIPKDKK